MKLSRTLSLGVALFLGVAATAQQAALTLTDEARRQIITVTAINPDIVRVDVRPTAATNATPLPSLALNKVLNAPRPQVDINDGADFAVLQTGTGLRVVCDKRLNSVSVSCGNTFFTTDLCQRDGGTLRLLHAGRESFYGAGERGYSLNLAGDTLINYNKQNYGYQGGERRTNQMGITMPLLISSRGYGIFFDDFCKSTLVVGEQGLEYTTSSPQPVSYFVINGNGRVEEVVKHFTALVGR